MGETTAVTVHFENSQPILRVEDMETSLRFYAGKLGFKNASWGSEDFTCITRDGAVIYLCRGDQGRGGAWVWIGVENAEKLHDELKALGVAIHSPLTNHSWALEFRSKTLTATCCALDLIRSKERILSEVDAGSTDACVARRRTASLPIASAPIRPAKMIIDCQSFSCGASRTLAVPGYS